MDNFIRQIASFLYGIALFLHIDTQVAKALIWLIFIDMIFGAIKSSLLNNLKFSFDKFWQGLIKKIMLLIIVMVLGLTANGLGFDDFDQIITVVMKVMIVNETISIFNNFRSIKDKKEYRSSDFISLLIQKIENYLNKYLNKLLSLFDDDKDKIQQ